MSIKEFKLGDAFTRITKFLHIPYCKNCERRRIVLNELQTAGVRETLRKLKECCD